MDGGDGTPKMLSPDISAGAYPGISLGNPGCFSSFQRRIVAGEARSVHPIAMLRKTASILLAIASFLSLAVTGFYGLAMIFFANADDWLFSDISFAGAVGAREYAMLAAWFGGSVLLGFASWVVWTGGGERPQERALEDLIPAD